ncbi:uncharacterized protein EV422DRAFT_324384 [Fimicolochytrium jonesii]|uniref:uncharacterized protein n=1 Tax=Fimicolochytrium jonesii TaxID=1396493 RepID=UPI0022FEB51D|nr:uncharacterized protein EV422DRAFT_324384 [Fimicolochytrium jonesii]KAI8824534.1 hypothetical protein EV422DRAFT_324384 [Fimicolochytrium jonesii]
MPSTTNWWQVPGVIFNNFGASATSAGGTLIIERVNNHAASTTAQSQSSLVRRAPLVPVSNLTGVVLGRARSSDWHRCDGFCLTADKPVAEWVFGSQIISGDHARIFFAKGQVLLEDLKSKNGTFVCKGVTEFGKPLPPKLAAEAPYTLVTGDIVVLGVKMVGEPLVALRVTWVPKASPLSAFPAPCTAPVATTTGVVPMFVVDKVGSKAVSASSDIESILIRSDARRNNA